MKILSVLSTFLTIHLVFGSVCEEGFDAMICENFEFSPEVHLDSTANKLIIRKAKGTITRDNLSDLKLVKEVIITENALLDIEPGALCTLPNITSIIFTKNKKLPRMTRSVMKNCDNLKHLYLNGPEVVIENDVFVDASNLESLEMNEIVLPRILESKFFEGLEALKSLTIEHSKLREIKEDAFNQLKNLEFLDLQANNIEEIAPETFHKLSELKVLNLANNKLKNLIWEEFQGLHSLRVLFLEHNDFDEVNVEKLVSSVPHLERIFLSYDKLLPANRKEIVETLPKFNIALIYIGKPYE